MHEKKEEEFGEVRTELNPNQLGQKEKWCRKGERQGGGMKQMKEECGCQMEEDVLMKEWSLFGFGGSGCT